MGRSSTKEHKNIYQLKREECGFTREEASEKTYISTDKIERIENRGVLPHPDDVISMAKAYREPALCNYYCSKECPIGQQGYIQNLRTRRRQLGTGV